jgi:hypothetical protein
MMDNYETYIPNSFTYFVVFRLSVSSAHRYVQPNTVIICVNDTAARWVKVPGKLAKIQNCQVHENALQTIFGKNTDALLGTASAFVSLVPLAELQSVAGDTAVESGLQRR